MSRPPTSPATPLNLLPTSPPHPSPLGYHRALGLSSLRPQLMRLAICFPRGDVFQGRFSQFVPPACSPLCPQACCLRLCLYCCPAKMSAARLCLCLPALLLENPTENQKEWKGAKSCQSGRWGHLSLVDLDLSN